MSIVALNKVWIIGQLQRKAEILDALQSLGLVHLVDLEVDGPPTEEPGSRLGRSLSEHLENAIRYLDESPVKRRQATFDTDVDIESLIHQVVENQKLKRALTDRVDALTEREKTLRPWGNFCLPDIDELEGQRLWFYILPHKYRSALKRIEYPWYIAHQDSAHHWVILVSRSEPPPDVLPVDRCRTGSLALDEIIRQRLAAEIALEDAEADRQRLTRWISIFKRHRARAQDSSAMDLAARYSAHFDEIFILHGWVASEQRAALEQFCETAQTAVQFEACREEDQPPTLLKNPDAIKGGELLVNFYQTPAYGAWDPSLILMATFSIFFAMILSDAGYALVLVALLAAFWKPLSTSATGRAMRPLLAILLFVSTAWGIAVGSFFGHAFPPDSLLGKLKVLDVNNFDMMMAISVGCGIVHLIIANAYQWVLKRKSSQAWGHLGWIVVLLAGAAIGLTQADTSGRTSGYLFLGAGLAVVFVSGSDRKIHSIGSLVLRILDGLKALTNVTNLFGDVLSYLRLFALGLASASLALTFNDLADNAFASGGGLGLLGGILILLVGHLLNLLLSVVSGVVHGLRLNFIEFYKWALDGEGRPFRAFKKQEYPNE